MSVQNYAFLLGVVLVLHSNFYCDEIWKKQMCMNCTKSRCKLIWVCTIVITSLVVSYLMVNLLCWPYRALLSMILWPLNMQEIMAIHTYLRYASIAAHFILSVDIRSFNLPIFWCLCPDSWLCGKLSKQSNSSNTLLGPLWSKCKHLIYWIAIFEVMHFVFSLLFDCL